MIESYQMIEKRLLERAGKPASVRVSFPCEVQSPVSALHTSLHIVLEVTVPGGVPDETLALCERTLKVAADERFAAIEKLRSALQLLVDMS